MGEGGQSTSLHRCDGKERGSKILYFHPYLVRWSNLTIIFQMGRNHQLAKYVLFFYGLAAGVFMVWWNILIFSSKSVFRTVSGTVIAAANQRGFFWLAQQRKQNDTSCGNESSTRTFNHNAYWCSLKLIYIIYSENGFPKGKSLPTGIFRCVTLILLFHR